MKTSVKKFTAFILAITLALPFMVFAAAQDEKAQSNEPDIAYEMPEMRNEFEKHFLMSDGTITATTYSESVHYYDSATMSWEDVDNTLTLSKGRYSTPNNGGFYASFRADNKSEEMVRVTDGDYTLSWSVEIQNALGTKDTLKDTLIASITESEERGDKFALSKTTSGLKYSNPFTGGKLVTVDYIISQYKVKENITIYSPKDANVIYYTYNCGMLSATLNEDNTISFFNEYGEEVYTVHAPYMYDKNGAGSGSFNVSLTQQDEVCYVKVTPDKEWLNSKERSYPVIIDPTVTTSNYSSTYMDTYVSSAYPNTNYGNENKLYVGNWNSSINRIYLYIQPPTVPIGAQILNARLDMSMVYDSTTAGTFDIAQINSGWNVNSITYNNAGAYTIIESNVLAANLYRDILSFNLLSYYQSYYANTQARYGFVIKYHDETYNDYNVVYSNEHTNSAMHPKLTIVYSLQSESESNDTVATADEIDISPIPETTTAIQGGSSTVPGTHIDYDYFKFTVPRHGKIIVSLFCWGDYDYNVSISSVSTYGTTALGSFVTEPLPLSNARSRGSTAFTATDAAVYEPEYGDDEVSPNITYYICVSTSNANAPDYTLNVRYSASYTNLGWIYPIAGTQSTLNSIQINEITNVSSPVGYRTNEYHQGMDISIGETTLKSVADGAVIKKGYDSSAGNHICIYTNTVDPHDSSKHLVIVYMHLSSIKEYIKPNAPVQKGTEIGVSGNTGYSSGGHLHFEVYSTSKTFSECVEADNIKSPYVEWLVNPYEIYYNDVTFYGTPY